MQQAVGRILNGDEIEVEGQYCLPVIQPEPPVRGPDSSGSAAPQARLVENQPAFALIEMTCACGRKTYVRCQYADSKPDREVPQAQNEALEAPEQLSDQSNQLEKTQ
jgi:hypothetical protein